MQTVVHYQGTLAGRISQYDFSVVDAMQGGVVLEAYVCCADNETRFFRYELERMLNGTWHAYPADDMNQDWWEWGSWCAMVAKLPFMVKADNA